MRIFDSISSGPPQEARDSHQRLVRQNQLNRILAFTGLTIDDVVNHPIARNQVRGFFKLTRWMDRRLEIRELEKQWNPLRA